MSVDDLPPRQSSLITFYFVLCHVHHWNDDEAHTGRLCWTPSCTIVAACSERISPVSMSSFVSPFTTLVVFHGFWSHHSSFAVYFQPVRHGTVFLLCPYYVFVCVRRQSSLINTNKRRRAVRLLYSWAFPINISVAAAAAAR